MWLIELLKYLGESVLLEKVSPVFFMYQYQKGLLLRNGLFLKKLTAGWNFKVPIIDRYIVCNSVLETIFVSNVNITTKDNKSCTVSACFEFIVSDEVKFLIEANEAVSNIKDIAMGSIAENLIDCDWDSISKRKTLNEIKRTLNKDLEPYGVSVLRFWFTDITTTRVFTLVNQ